MRARRKAESAEHRSARLQQVRAHNNERLASESAEQRDAYYCIIVEAI